MVLLGRAMMFPQAVRLSVKTTVVSGTVWPQFATDVLNGGCEPPVCGKGWS